MQTKRPAFRRAVEIILTVLAVIALTWAMLYSGRVATAKLFAKYGTTVVDTAALDIAIGLAPKDAEVHYARGAVSNYLQQPADALNELELAVSLRPHDYYFWLELGMTRDQLGDQTGALAAFNEAVRLAPYYAQPRWQRGNLLFRKGKYEEAFVDLRQAAASDPSFRPALIDLAWGTSGKDARVTEEILQVQSEKGHYALALFFARHGQADAAVAQFFAAGSVSVENRRDIIKELLSSRSIAQAYDLWSGKNGVPPPVRGSIFDGGFEGSLNRDETGFGWRLLAAQSNLSLSLDGSQPQSGGRSLRIDFSGHGIPLAEIVSQLIPVDPAVRYKLNFAARTHEIVTGGPPLVMVKDANSQALLGHSCTLPGGTTGWQIFSVEFSTGASTQAIVVSLQREECTTSPCPIFGSLYLDSFSLERLK
ncbi:MAG: hypothetical protein JWM21_1355 [Acidobacteria bacterium]|nr:hypothetical protein [Acidobacteriota bacterium]